MIPARRQRQRTDSMDSSNRTAAQDREHTAVQIPVPPFIVTAKARQNIPVLSSGESTGERGTHRVALVDPFGGNDKAGRPLLDIELW